MKLFALIAAVAASFAVPAAFELSAEPLTPPGETQPITPPAPMPILAPPVEPTPDPIEPQPFAIVAMVGGAAIVDEPVVAVEPGAMLRLTLTGGGVEPYSLDVRQRKVRWTLSQPTKNWAEVYEGHAVFFCHPKADDVFLATATINNPDPLEPPFVAMRWVKVGGVAPQPPPVEPDKPSPVEPTPSIDKATAATYVYEKDEGAVPSGVLVGLDRLNREKKITASAVDVDVVDGNGETPDQFKAAFAAAREHGLPVLIVTAGDKVIRTVAKPATESQVWEAVP